MGKTAHRALGRLVVRPGPFPHFSLRAPWRDEAGRSLTLLWAAAPILLTLTVSLQFPFHVYMDRYLILAQPAWLLLLAHSLAGPPSDANHRCGGSLGFLALRLLLLGSLLYGDYHLLRSPPRIQKEDWRAVAAYLNTHARENELILLRTGHIAIPFHAYPLARRVSIWEINRTARPFADLASPYPGVWLVYWNTVSKTHIVLHEWVYGPF